MKIYNKLVRDKIPEIIASDNGKTCVTRIMEDGEYLETLNTKMQEELKEYLESGDVEELADLEFLVPDGIENVPKRYAMSHRNDWMIKECDFAVVYCLYSGSNTQKYIDKLNKSEKTVVNIAELTSEADCSF